jgi:two-component system CheB/CheR fusion protein
MPDHTLLKTNSPRARFSRRAVTARASPAADFLIVGLGSSAGGLEACRKLVAALPADSGMAFVLVQHLDPTHKSMMVDLLSGHTSLTVLEATDGRAIEPNHLYIIAPGTYLSVGNGCLRVSKPQARHGARLPFDFLLHSLADEFASRAVCVILSGTGSDGSLGLTAVKEKSGLVIAQDPGEAGYDGMPRSAIATGSVDLVLPIAAIPDALANYSRRLAIARATTALPHRDPAQDWLPQIVELLRTRTSHDFTLYKPGTLQRRIERRMALAAIETRSMNLYLELLRHDAKELDLLAKDLLINVTNFFRDPNVFEFLGVNIVPDLIRDHPVGQPLRIWIAGCSTGEETYSLAMLFREAIAAAKSDIKLQVFASDVDPDAVATAREGLYPETIEACVSPARLARFFVKEDHSYRVLPALRSAVVFTVQDVLADPPFSRLDLVSCRNLLIYLRPEAQAKTVSVFHFALREGGILLLGSSETIGNIEGRFELISKSERVYRHIGRSRPGDFGFLTSAHGGMRAVARSAPEQSPSRQAALAELCTRAVIDVLAPAAVLINRKYECLYFLGPTDRYLKIATGRAIHDLLAMAREGVRTKLRSAIQRACQENARVIVSGGRLIGDRSSTAFSITVQPMSTDGEDLLLICFVDSPEDFKGRRRPKTVGNPPRVVELEQELEVTRTELEGAIHNLEISSEEQKAINEEALSVNEEFQSTNEELLTSKEELQSLNEELTALNTQLQETLERQRTTSNDLQNVLYSTDVATLFLDSNLNIRFFTPATKSLFHVIPGDVGRPLADLSSLAVDDALLADARTVLRALTPIEREIEAQNGSWYARRISPYRTQDQGVEGVVITFSDITERRHAADSLEIARGQAQLANSAKSRFLAAASHDLRQPLQSLVLLQGLLEKAVKGESAAPLVGRLDETLRTMSAMLDGLLDVNQIEAGTVTAEISRFPISALFDRLTDEFTLLAQAKGLELHIVSSEIEICSDARLLAQMIRNLLSNALKYTPHGKLLLGCRRVKGVVRIEVWDTGIGIPAGELQAIFEEYHQLDNSARERSRGLGLGLAIVQRLGNLLGHRIDVRSRPGFGSVFAIEVALPPSETKSQLALRHREVDGGRTRRSVHTAAILVIEDDPELRELLQLLLNGEGHHAVAVTDGDAAEAAIARGAIRPDLVLADYNLPGGRNGLQVAAKLRTQLEHVLPVIILTGDISTATLRDIARQDCVRLNKPVKSNELMEVIQRLLPTSQVGARTVPVEPAPAPDESPVIFIVDDDRRICEEMRAVLVDGGWTVEVFSSCESFLDAYRPGREACLLLDAYLPEMSGLELLKRLKDANDRMPTIMITGVSDVGIAVQAMKAGAADFIEKPVAAAELLAGVAHALEQARDSRKQLAWRDAAAGRLATLTVRQREIMDMVLAGKANKNIAVDLRISQRTVENHRAAIMRRTGSNSIPALARLALAAAWKGGDEPLVENVSVSAASKRNGGKA